MKEKKSLWGIIDPVIFLPAFLIMSFCAIVGFWYYDVFLDALLAIYNWATGRISWLPYSFAGL